MDSSRSESEVGDRLEALMEYTSECVAQVADDGRVLLGVDGLRRLLGADIAPHIWDLLARIHPDDVAAVTQSLDDAAANPGLPARVCARASGDDGTFHFLRLAFMDRSADARVRGWVVHVADATSDQLGVSAIAGHASAEDLFHRFSSDAMVVIDAETNISYTSRSIERLLGYTAEEMLGTRGLTWVHPDDAVLAMEKLAEALATPGHVVTARLRLLTRGGYRTFEIQGRNHIHDPLVDGIVLVYRDVQAETDALEALQASEERFRTLVESSPLGVFELDTEGELVWANERWAAIAGGPFEEYLGARYQRYVHRSDQHAVVQSWLQRPDPRAAVETTYRWLRPDGEWRWLNALTAPRIGPDGQLAGHVGTVRDITEELEASKWIERLSKVVQATSDLVLIVDDRGSVIWANATAQRAIGDRATVQDLFGLGGDIVFRSEVVPRVSSGRSWMGEVQLSTVEQGVLPLSVSASGHVDANGDLIGIALIGRDIRDRLLLEAELERQASTDPLTGLPNRTLLRQFLDNALARHAGEPVAVLFCDLDDFKVVNDSLGHHHGDRVIRSVAQRLQKVVRPGDLVARFGGDEFVVVCPGASMPAVVDDIGRRLADAIAEPIVADGRVLRVRASVGVAISQAGATADDVLRDADVAMYRAKVHARGGIEVFDDALRQEVVERHNIEQALRSAISAEQLRLHYQPIVDVRTGNIVRIEALCRWTDPELGEVSPATFIPIAEETGLIADLGTWVLRSACRDLATLRRAGASFGVGVNVSLLQVARPDFVSDVLAAIREAGIALSDLELEITESVLMDHGPDALDKLGSLRSRGVRVAIDDFGTGYSSLSYLHRFDFDTLKIDRAFLHQLGGTEQEGRDVVVEAVVGMAQKLRLATVAEGVEDERGQAVVERLGFDLVQGDFYAPAMPLEHLLARLGGTPGAWGNPNRAGCLPG